MFVFSSIRVLLRMTIFGEIIGIILFILVCTPLWSQMNIPTNEWIIRLHNDSNLTKLQTDFEDASLRIRKTISKKHQIYVLESIDLSKSTDQYIDYLATHPSILYYQKNHRVEQRSQVPNDTNFNKQWSLDRIGATNFWNTSTGGVTALGDTIVVAVIDSGFDHLHEDLYENVWKNHGEIPNDGIDNDGNGKKDDYYGWNFRYKNDKHHQTPNIGIPHGTSVAGIIGGVGNNGIGITGVNWNVKMMLLSVKGLESDIVEAYFYILEQRELYDQTNGEQGAFVVASTISLGIKRVMPEDFPVWCDMYDILGEKGILNVGATANDHYDVDIEGDIPTSCTSDFLITVTNSDQNDELEFMAGFGKQSIDLAAPGTGSFTTDPNNKYDDFGGTSAATPHVAGAIALAYALPCPAYIEAYKNDPATMALALKSNLLEGTDQIPSFESKTLSGGRLNISNISRSIRTYCEEVALLTTMKIVPNPISKEDAYFEIQYETINYDQHFVKIYNSLGQLQFEDYFFPPDFNEKTYQVPNRLLSGMYYVVLGNSRGNVVSELIFVK